MHCQIKKKLIKQSHYILNTELKAHMRKRVICVNTLLLYISAFCEALYSLGYLSMLSEDTVRSNRPIASGGTDVKTCNTKTAYVCKCACFLMKQRNKQTVSSFLETDFFSLQPNENLPHYRYQCTTCQRGFDLKTRCQAQTKAERHEYYG